MSQFQRGVWSRAAEGFRGQPGFSLLMSALHEAGWYWLAWREGMLTRTRIQMLASSHFDFNFLKGCWQSISAVKTAFLEIRKAFG